MISTTVEFARSIDEGTAKSICGKILSSAPQGSWAMKPWYDSIWHRDEDDLVVRPQRALVTAATYSTNLDLKLNGGPAETDFALSYRREQLGGGIAEEPAFVVGEAKSFAHEAIRKADVDRLQAVGKKLPGTFLVFSVLHRSPSDSRRWDGGTSLRPTSARRVCHLSPDLYCPYMETMLMKHSVHITPWIAFTHLRGPRWPGSGRRWVRSPSPTAADFSRSGAAPEIPL